MKVKGFFFSLFKGNMRDTNKKTDMADFKTFSKLKDICYIMLLKGNTKTLSAASFHFQKLYHNNV